MRALDRTQQPIRRCTTAFVQNSNHVAAVWNQLKKRGVRGRYGRCQLHWVLKVGTRQRRAERALGMRRLRELEDLGHALRIMSGARTSGRKPAE